MPAQGNALGMRPHRIKPKGRHNRCLALSGLGMFLMIEPRALPWAGMSRPFGADRVISTMIPGALPQAGMVTGLWPSTAPEKGKSMNAEGRSHEDRARAGGAVVCGVGVMEAARNHPLARVGSARFYGTKVRLTASVPCRKIARCITGAPQ